MHKPAVGWVSTPLWCSADAGTYKLSLVQVIRNPSLNIFTFWITPKTHNKNHTQKIKLVTSQVSKQVLENTGERHWPEVLSEEFHQKGQENSLQILPPFPKTHGPAECCSEPHPHHLSLHPSASSVLCWSSWARAKAIKARAKSKVLQQQSPSDSNVVLGWSFQQINCSPHKQGRETNFLENSNNSVIGNSHFVHKRSGIDPPQPVIFCAISFTLNLQFQIT